MLEILLYAGRAIMPLLLTMALGCWLRHSAHWSDDFYRQLNSFCFHVLLPVQLFLNVYAIEDLSVLNWRLLGFIVLCIVGAAGLGVAVAPLFARERQQRVVIAQATFRANQVIMGIPLASALGGPGRADFRVASHLRVRASIQHAGCADADGIQHRRQIHLLAGGGAADLPQPSDPGRAGGSRHRTGAAAAAAGGWPAGVLSAQRPAVHLQGMQRPV